VERELSVAEGSSDHATASHSSARVPLLPPLSGRTFWGRRGGSFADTTLGAGAAVPTASGRAAIALALAELSVQPDDKVLVPAFHCLSMVEPVRAAGAVPVYYRIRPDVSVDIEDIRARIDGSTRALLVVHYFGFPQDMPGIRALCDAHGLALIEDCAHAFFGRCGGHPVGWHGDYAIASAKKFFPVQDGGYLVSARHALDASKVRASGLLFNLKVLVNTLEYAMGYGRLRGLSVILGLPLRLQRWLWQSIKQGRRSQLKSLGPQPSGEFRHFDPNWMFRRMSLVSRAVVALASKSEIARRRRDNYTALVQAFSGMSNARPLFPKLPSDVVPYMFPLLIDDPARVFTRLKEAGVPMYRWEEIESDVCATSRAYALQLLQLPCHQDLTASELHWLIESIHKVLAASAN
jgi:perosamine synthetase